MKKNYEFPKLEILETAVDVITASAGTVQSTMNKSDSESEQQYVGSQNSWKDVWG